MPDLAKVDVSGAFDNCFFHAYAAHLLANNLPLPYELFKFNSLLGKESPASQLQKSFPNVESLSLFAHNTPLAAASSSFIVEKTLVLGVLMREWFATKMHEDTNHRDKEAAQVVDNFKTYKELVSAPGFDPQLLLSGEQGVLFSANADFLNYFSKRPKYGLLSNQEDHFESFFRRADGNVEAALAEYWVSEGHNAYCKQLAQLDTKLAPNDVLPVLSTLGQRTEIKAGRRKIPQELDAAQASSAPVMAIRINGAAGHYYLEVTEQSKGKLGEYQRSYKQYLSDREAILNCATPEAKQNATQNSQSLLVGAILPKNEQSQNAFPILLAQVEQIHQAVNAKRREYNQVSLDVEGGVTQNTPQPEVVLRARLEAKLHELLDYSEVLDRIRSKRPELNISHATEVTRNAIDRLCVTLSNPESFKITEATALLKEISRTDDFKERYDEMILLDRNVRNDCDRISNTPTRAG